MMARTVSERLLNKLRSEPELAGLIDENATCRRIYSSSSARSAGAWSWELNNNSTPIGSQFSMKDCLRSSELSIYRDSAINFYHVDPVDFFKR